MTELLQIDAQLFQLFNGVWHHPFLDAIMPLWRSKYVWIPLYLFIGSFLLLNFKLKGFVVIVFAVLTITVSDTISSKVIKPNVKRPRPCREASLSPHVRTLIHCGGGYSFTSSHATNHFALAIFLISIFGKRFKWVKFPLLFWAASIAYGQVYVGVHYPLDILAGSLVGSFIGWRMYRLYVSKPLQGFQIPALLYV